MKWNAKTRVIDAGFLFLFLLSQVVNRNGNRYLDIIAVNVPYKHTHEYKNDQEVGMLSRNHKTLQQKRMTLRRVRVSTL